MADYGKTTGNYTPSTVIYTGAIGKIAEQVIRSERVSGKFSPLFKGTFETGKDLEVLLLKRVHGVAYSSTTPPAANPVPTDVLYHTTDLRRTFPALIDQKYIDESVINAENATKYAAEVVAAMYNGAYEEENANVVSILKDAQSASNQIVDSDYSYNDYGTERGCKELLQHIETTVEYIRRGESSVNPRGNKVAAERVGVLIPARIMKGIDVWARISAYNKEYTTISADDVFTYTPDEGDAGEIFVFDEDYVQLWKTHADSYREHPVAGCDNVQAFLHRYTMLAGCPLFSCVRIKQASAPVDYNVKTVKVQDGAQVNAVMYGTVGDNETKPVKVVDQGGVALLQTSDSGVLVLDGTLSSMSNTLGEIYSDVDTMAYTASQLNSAMNISGETVVHTATRG